MFGKDDNGGIEVRIMEALLFDSEDNYGIYDTNKLYTVQKSDVDEIVRKALSVKPNLFNEGYEVNVSPMTNTVWLAKHSPLRVNDFESRDMVYAIGIQICRTDREINRVFAVYETPEQFGMKYHPNAIEGFEYNRYYDRAMATDENTNAVDVLNRKADMTGFVIKRKLNKMKGIDKQDLPFLGELEDVFQTEYKSSRVNDRNEYLEKLYSLGCVEWEEHQFVDRDKPQMALKWTTKPQYIYKAYQFIMDASRNIPNISNLRYDVDTCTISFNQIDKNGHEYKMALNVLNDHLEYKYMLFDLNSTVDKERFKGYLPELCSWKGDDMETRFPLGGRIMEGKYTMLTIKDYHLSCRIDRRNEQEQKAKNEMQTEHKTADGKEPEKKNGLFSLFGKKK